MTLLDHKKLLSLLCFFPSKFGFVPIILDQKTFRLTYQEKSKEKARKYFNVQFLLCLVLSFQGVACFGFKSLKFKYTFIDKIAYIFVTVSLLAGLSLQKSCVQKVSSQCFYINGIIQLATYTRNVLGIKHHTKKSFIIHKQT